MRKKRGFTLIELLVVVAIIALLIAILLPSLGKARENARITVCATHMRQIALSVLMYIDQNNNNMITAGIVPGVEIDPTHSTTVSQFWANDLASQGYLPSKNNVDPAGSNSVVSTATIFYCPDGDTVENIASPTGGNITYTGYCPRSSVNRMYVKSIAATPAVGDTAAFTWYMLNCHNISSQSRYGLQGGTGSGAGGACAFVQWNKATGTGGETLGQPGGYNRRLQMVTATQKFVMILEGSGISWDANGNIAPTDNGGVLAPTNGHPERLSGRHGDALNNGYDGLTNMAYFDGHVTKQLTVPYSNNPAGGGATYTLASSDGGFTLPAVVPDTYFYFNSQP